MNTAEDLIGIDEKYRSEKDMSYRAMPQGPKTLDQEARTLEFVISTEDPVLMWDWERGEYVDEVLLAKGMSMPKQVPLLDTHSRWSVSDVLGSVRNKVVEEEKKLVSGTARFSTVKEGENAMIKYDEGHLTDFSAGYRNNNVTHVKKGEVAEIGGRSFKGPVNVVTSWTLKEVSCCPIGADPKAKARAENGKTNEGDNKMPGEEKDNGVDTKQLATDVGDLKEGFKDLKEVITSRFAEEDKLTDGEKAVEEERKAALIKPEQQRKKERARILEIDKMCVTFNIDDDFRAKLIEDGTDVEKSRELIMERLAARSSEDLTTGLRVQMGAEGKDKLREGIEDAMKFRAGIDKDNLADGNEFRSYSILEMARVVLRANSIVPPDDKWGLAGRAMSTSDFTNILANVAHNALNEGFEKANETYSIWCDTGGRVEDFKAHQISRASEYPSLEEVNPDGGEVKYGQMSDTKESVTAVDYGIITPFTRKAMVNDEIGALADIRTKQGEAAARKYGDLCYAVLTGSTTMGDGNSLWDDTNHGNHTDSGAAPTAALIAAGEKKMAIQKDLQSIQTLNIRARYVLSPFALKHTFDTLLHTTTPVVVGANTVNPLPDGKAVYDARLDTASATAWYLAAEVGKTVQLFTLGGQMTPTQEMQVDFTTNSIDFKVMITAAAIAVDWRGLYKNDGA